MEALSENSATAPDATWSARLLIADDQPDVLEALRLLFKPHGYEVHMAGSPEAILERLRNERFDLLLMDLNYSRDTTSGREGIDVLARIRGLGQALPIVAMTAWGSIELAVEALHKGAADFVLKPWDDERLVGIVRAQLEQARNRCLTEVRDPDNEVSNREILEARDVHRRFLPTEIPQFPGFEISGACQTAGAVGGDYFDVFGLGSHHAAICVGDAAGKSVAGALLMSNLQAAVRVLALETARPATLCRRINQIVRANVAPDRFITFFYANLDVPRKTLAYTNAGHNAPVLARADGSVVRLEEGGPLLGVFPEPGYRQCEVALAAGDRLLLFTDGVTEVTNPADIEFGEEGLISLIAENRNLGARALQECILSSVSRFSNGHFQDDATLLVAAVN